MISHKHKFIFVHIPRTGGTSIATQLGQNNKADKHRNLYQYKKELEKEIFNQYFKFTFVRNPWDVIISKYLADWYNNKKCGGRIGNSSGKSLKFFLETYTIPDHESGDTFSDFFCKKEIDFVGKYENREDHLNFVSENIGFKINLNIHIGDHNKKNFSKKTKHYTEYYDDETRQIVAEKYAKDIEYFGYEFGQ